jgi:hypothetical protein
LVQYGSLNQTNKNIRPIGKKSAFWQKNKKKVDSGEISLGYGAAVVVVVRYGGVRLGVRLG